MQTSFKIKKPTIVEVSGLLVVPEGTTFVVEGAFGGTGSVAKAVEEVFIQALRDAGIKNNPDFRVRVISQEMSHSRVEQQELTAVSDALNTQRELEAGQC